MSTLTVVILYSGEEDDLSVRLDEMRSADEIIILEDATEHSKTVTQLQKQYACKIYLHLVNGDFAQHRNFGLSKSTSDWTLFIDCDESVSPELWGEIRDVMASSQYDSFYIPRRDVFLGQKLLYGETGRTLLLRLCRTQKGLQRWERPVHETWKVPGNTGNLRNPLWHNQSHTVKEFLQKLHYYASIEPSSRTVLSRRKVVFQLFTYPVGKFIQAIFLHQGWRDGVRGWIHAFLMSYYSLIVRIYCWETWYAARFK